MTGLIAIGISIRPFLRNVRFHKTKVYLTLPGWTAMLTALGLILGLGLKNFTSGMAMLIIFGLFALIPLYAWIDAKVIYKNGSWGIKEYIWGCLYEIGVVTVGASLALITFG